jgi:hypothetical protein
MPVLMNLRLPLTVEEIASSWGSRRTRLASARLTAMLFELLAQIEAEGWIQPKISFDVWPIVSNGPGWLEMRGGSRISSPTLGHHLPGAVYLAAGACTIGDAVEKRVSQRFAASDRLWAVLLDEIGTLSLFRLGDRLEALLKTEARRRGLQAGGMLSPGEDGFEISQQAAVLTLAHGAEIGILQTASGLLMPRKSLTAVVGWGDRMPHWSRGERCARCGARARCPHRRIRTSGVAQ